jgi:hypothetical protein
MIESVVALKPELYFTLLHKLISQTEVGSRHNQIQPSSLRPSPFPSHPDRLAKVLDAFASICLHEPKGQVVALSASLTKENARLFISENKKVDDKVLAHLYKVWGLFNKSATHWFLSAM